MAEDVENLVLEHLRHIRGAVDLLREGVQELQHRITLLELGQASMRRDIATVAENQARLQISFDRLEGRVARIERRLDLAPA